METEKNISGISENLLESIEKNNAIENEQKENRLLDGMKIAISVSSCEELEELGFSEQHIKDISIEIARYLIVNGAKLLYGGDLRIGGFTELFSELSYQYKYLHNKERRFINYFYFPSSQLVTTDELAKFHKKQVEPILLKIPDHIGTYDPNKKYDPFESIEDRFFIAECLSEMRYLMAKDCKARIVVGGKQKKYLGYLPGILEETYFSLKEGKAVYLIGGFGGAAKSIIDVIIGGNSKHFDNDFHFDTDFLKQFKDFVSSKTTVPVDYTFLTTFFRNNTVDIISKNNGLSIEENYILFESTNIHELVFLIIKGLTNIEHHAL